MSNSNDPGLEEFTRKMTGIIEPDILNGMIMVLSGESLSMKLAALVRKRIADGVKRLSIMETVDVKTGVLRVGRVEESESTDDLDPEEYINLVRESAKKLAEDFGPNELVLSVAISLTVHGAVEIGEDNLEHIGEITIVSVANAVGHSATALVTSEGQIDSVKGEEENRRMCFAGIIIRDIFSAQVDRAVNREAENKAQEQADVEAKNIINQLPDTLFDHL